MLWIRCPVGFGALIQVLKYLCTVVKLHSGSSEGRKGGGLCCPGCGLSYMPAVLVCTGKWGFLTKASFTFLIRFIVLTAEDSLIMCEMKYRHVKLSFSKRIRA